MDEQETVAVALVGRDADCGRGEKQLPLFGERVDASAAAHKPSNSSFRSATFRCRVAAV
jgi:hypothetical protein